MDLWFLVSKFRKKVLANVAASLARDSLLRLVSNLTLSAINNLTEKSGKGAFIAGKEFILFISNENMNDIPQIIKSLEHSGVLIDGVTETVKNETKNKKAYLLEFW